jgi:hypothetical protein
MMIGASARRIVDAGVRFFTSSFVVLAPSIPTMVTIYLMLVMASQAEAARFATAALVSVPVTVFANLGIRTLVLTKADLSPGQASTLRGLLVVPTALIVPAVCLVFFRDALFAATWLVLARSFDGLSEIWISRELVEQRQQGLFSLSLQRVALLVAVGGLAASIGGTAATVAATQLTAAVVWFVARERNVLTSATPLELTRLLRRLAPLGVAALVSSATFTAPRLVAAGFYDDADIAAMGAITTIPLVLSGLMGSAFEVSLGQKVAGRARFVDVIAAKTTVIGTLLAAALSVVLLIIARTADDVTLGFFLTAVASVLAVASSCYGLVLHVQERFRAILTGRLLAVLSSCIAVYAFRTIGVASIGAALALGQLLILAVFRLESRKPLSQGGSHYALD